ncbi:MAG TPA: prepilin-type N-terminal cleavage/methylation domain-containing protein [Candidatus Sulfotelmatobacter sp.]|nr:prepilin-type N-terminal cleavage/methylation domain-containing protein [Candidatus Sulfotelmatobacter sp.]
MKNHLDYSGSHERGFSLIEMMIVSAILLIVTGAIFAHLNNAQQRMTTEQSKVDDFDQARDFVDQFFRDINQIGYPNARMMSFLPAFPQSQAIPQVAVGLVQIGNNTIAFEGDINQSGVVQEVQYVINGSGNCAQCLQRSEIPKVAGPPLTQMQNGAIWGTEVNDVISNPIFTYYDGTSVNPIPIPAGGLDIVNNGPVLATVKTIHIALTIQNPNVIDPRTKQPIQTTFEGEVSLNNCSMAAVGVPPMSCQ